MIVLDIVAMNTPTGVQRQKIQSPIVGGAMGGKSMVKKDEAMGDIL